MPKSTASQKKPVKSAVGKPAKKRAAAKAAAGKTTAAKPEPKARASAAGAHIPVRVRMYRQGLGDCFLITFDPGGDETHMLVDCGSLGATTTGNEMKDIVADIRRTTKDHLHLVIATHEHKDHVSGFHSFKKEFQKMTADHVWLAWTEDPEDKLAQKLQKFKGDLGKAVAMAAAALAKNPADGEAMAMAGAMRSLLEFSGELEALGSDKLATTVDDGMTFIRTGLTKPSGKPVQADYLMPGGEAQEPSWLGGFRFHVLGPPRSESRLRELGDHGSKELYGMAASVQSAAALRAAANDQNTLPPQDDAMPFDLRFRCLANDPLVESYQQSYFSEASAWRRIDNEWMNAAAELALQLDSLTNNTSLALAVERISDGKVLLFPADAQQGHWLSWHEPEKPFTYTVGNEKHTTTAEKLLNQTVFYKAGHHGSHNATAKGKGLEMMTRKNDLVAFIPVDRQVALSRNPKDSWQMPAHDLYLRLLQQCQGRVVRSDIGWAHDAKDARLPQIEKEFVHLADEATWKGWKKAQDKANDIVRVEDLYIDYTLK